MQSYVRCLLACSVETVCYIRSSCEVREFATHFGHLKVHLRSRLQAAAAATWHGLNVYSIVAVSTHTHLLCAGYQRALWNPSSVLQHRVSQLVCTVQRVQLASSCYVWQHWQDAVAAQTSALLLRCIAIWHSQLRLVLPWPCDTASVDVTGIAVLRVSRGDHGLELAHFYGQTYSMSGA
jgi:hypothetical protein